jgi:hypothetical protein
VAMPMIMFDTRIIEVLKKEKKKTNLHLFCPAKGKKLFKVALEY